MNSCNEHGLLAEQVDNKTMTSNWVIGLGWSHAMFVLSQKRNISKVTKEGKMGKDKTIFVCSSCGYESAKWLGKCPACNEWNSFYEEKIIKENKNSAEKGKKNATQKC